MKSPAATLRPGRTPSSSAPVREPAQDRPAVGGEEVARPHRFEDQGISAEADQVGLIAQPVSVQLDVLLAEPRVEPRGLGTDVVVRENPGVARPLVRDRIQQAADGRHGRGDDVQPAELLEVLEQQAQAGGEQAVHIARADAHHHVEGGRRDGGGMGCHRFGH